jgi:thiosulfate dehydrogenase (quinone) large subunit
MLIPMRLFLGVTFIYAGIQKLADPQFFKPTAPGYIGRQIIGFAHGSPLHGFLLQFVVPHSHFFGVLIIAGEIAIGLGTLAGFLLRPAAFFGLLISLLFYLTVSWHVYPYFYGALLSPALSDLGEDLLGVMLEETRLVFSWRMEDQMGKAEFNIGTNLL